MVGIVNVLEKSTFVALKGLVPPLNAGVAPVVTGFGETLRVTVQVLVLPPIVTPVVKTALLPGRTVTLAGFKVTAMGCESVNVFCATSFDCSPTALKKKRIFSSWISVVKLESEIFPFASA